MDAWDILKQQKQTDWLLSGESVRDFIVIPYFLDLTPWAICARQFQPRASPRETPGICFTMSPGGRAFDS